VRGEPVKNPWYERLAGRCESRDINGRSDLDAPYLVRYFVFRSPLLSVYLHKIMRPDDTADLHDHPWGFFHVLLCGGYREEWLDRRAVLVAADRGPGRWAFHRAGYAHRIGALTGGPVWTLVVVGPRCRKWGFVDRTKRCWTHWKAYTREGFRCE
jgi:hypothetical protein